MPDLLAILNPRSIRECISAFESLDIDRVWIRRMYECDVTTVWPEVMEAAEGYDRMFLASDDCCPRQQHLDVLTELLDAGHPVVTGYSNLSAVDMRVNLTKSPLGGPEPKESAYDLYTLAEVMQHEDPVVPTTVTGYSLTGMSVEMWREYGYATWGGHPGCASDFLLSRKLAAKGVPIVAAREAFVWHVKEVWNRMDGDPRKRLLIGEEPAEVVLDRRRVVEAVAA